MVRTVLLMVSVVVALVGSGTLESQAQGKAQRKPAYHKPAAPVRPPRPTRPVHPVRPTRPVRPHRPIKPNHPVRPHQPTMPNHPVKPHHPAHPTKPTAPVKPPIVVHPTHPTRPTHPFHPTHPTRPVKPVLPVHPTHPLHPTRPVKPIQQVKPTRPVHPTRPVEPTHQVRPTRPHVSRPSGGSDVKVTRDIRRDSKTVVQKLRRRFPKRVVRTVEVTRVRYWDETTSSWKVYGTYTNQFAALQARRRVQEEGMDVRMVTERVQVAAEEDTADPQDEAQEDADGDGQAADNDQ